MRDLSGSIQYNNINDVSPQMSPDLRRHYKAYETSLKDMENYQKKKREKKKQESRLNVAVAAVQGSDAVKVIIHRFRGCQKG